MAIKTQKKTIDLSAAIISSYMDYVLKENKQPVSVYAFAAYAGIAETEFYKYFTSFAAIDASIWKDAAANTINSLEQSPEFREYNTREKVLGFFYTLVEAMNMKRSYFIYSLKSDRPLHRNLAGFKEQVLAFSKDIIRQGLVDKELEERKFISDKYHDAVWLNTIFILNFWSNDDSQGFTKTDAAIEKSVNLMLELMGKSSLDSMLDLGKFLFQNAMNKTKM